MTATVEKVASDQKEGTDRYVADLERKAADAAKAGRPQCTGALAVLSTTPTLGSCAKGPGQAVLERDLPATPDSRPVPAPDCRKGDNPKAKLAKTLYALEEANDRIVEGRNWYDGVRRDYRGPE